MPNLFTISHDDVSSMIERKTLREQLWVLQDIFWYEVREHTSTVSDKLENIFYVENSEGKMSIFVKDIGLLDFWNLERFVDEVVIEKHNLELSNQIDHEFHMPFVYVYVMDEGIYYAYEYKPSWLIQIKWDKGEVSFSDKSTLWDAIGNYKAQIHIQSTQGSVKKSIIDVH